MDDELEVRQEISAERNISAAHALWMCLSLHVLHSSGSVCGHSLLSRAK
jgi:hypothetical protein